MNTEANQDPKKLSIGERLRTAREAKGMTQQNIADRLCLKLSTVRDIEDDKSPTELAATFLRGYIRSYARLVQIPEAELLPEIKQYAPVSPSKVAPLQSYAITNRRNRKKRDGLLTIFTWLIFFVVVGLTVAWWWQNHKAAQNELTNSISVQQESDSSGNQSLPLATTEQADPSNQQAMQNESQPEEETTTTEQAAPETTTPTATSSVNASTPAPMVANSNPAVSPSAPTSTTLAVNPAEVQTTPDALTVQFTADCWLEISDATGKKLFSGLQHRGASLSLNGKLPYRLKIGAPAAVSVQFRGQPVDLSRFVQRNQVARLSVGTP